MHARSSSAYSIGHPESPTGAHTTTSMENDTQSQLSRRGFLAASALSAAALPLASSLMSSSPWAAQAHSIAGRGASARLKVGVIGCGGRGTGAAVNILEASPDVQIVAIGDMFKDRTDSCRAELAKQEPEFASRVSITDETTFHGFDAYKQVLAAGVDIVILASAPGFRPVHFAAAVEAGKHVFMEKPVAVDPAGVRKVVAAARAAAERKLSVVAGTQRRHEICYTDALARVRDGAIGEVVGASVYWNQGGLWLNKRKPQWSEMENQLRNWLYYTWLSGDHIVEQHVHNLDVAYWFLGDELPSGVLGMGGRQVRTAPEYGHAFDHFAVEFEYASGKRVSSYCRQIDGATGRVEEVIHGTRGTLKLSQFGHAQITGQSPWKWTGEQVNPYVQEHKDLLASILGNSAYVNHGERIANSTMMAIAGRMSAYTGKTLTWTQAMESKLDLTPPKLELGDLPATQVAVPGRTPFM
jgi:predicted dehydrogenase